MSVNFSTNVISTKIRALYGKRLKEDDYNQLINKYSLSEIVEYLKNETYYHSTLEAVNQNTVHKGQVELLLKVAAFEKHARFLNYDISSQTEIFKYVILKNEMEEILTAIRLFNSGSMNKYVIRLPLFLTDYLSMNLKDFINVKSFDDLLKVVKGTIYYELMLKFKPNKIDGKLDVVRCEIEIRKAFFLKIFKMLDKDHDPKAIFLIDIETTNIVNIYRLKKFFNKDAKYIKSCLLPFYYYLKESVIDKMVEAENIDDFIKMVNQTKYGKYLNLFEHENIEKTIKKFICKKMKKSIRFVDHPSNIMMCYIYLMDVELENLITIIESISYKVSPEQIKQSIII